MTKTKRGNRKHKKGPASPWMKVIQDATFVVLKQQKHHFKNNNNNTDQQGHNKSCFPFATTSTAEEKKMALQKVDHSLLFLNSLSTILHSCDMQWPPTAAPPAFEPFQSSVDKKAPAVLTSSRESTAKAPLASPSAQQGNSFATLALSDDEDEEEDDEEEAGDLPIPQPLSPMAKPFVPKELDTIRLLIRLFSSRADLYAHKARLLGTDRQWLTGASALQSAIGALQNAMGLADSTITQYMMQEVADVSFFTCVSIQTNDGSSRRKHQLMQDSDIVHVAAQAVKEGRDQYLHFAELQVARLKRLLEPKWKSRERAMKSMGQAWFKNPNATYKHVRPVQEYEKELKDLQATVEALTTQDAEVLSVTAKHLKEKLQALWYQKNRYNQKNVKKNATRLEGFANPTNYGWGFTGSSDNKVEFYEKQLVEEVPPGSGMMAVSILKLDWFLQTGVAKMIMEHPVQGIIPLVDEVMTPKKLRQALATPLSFGGSGKESNTNSPSEKANKTTQNGKNDKKKQNSRSSKNGKVKQKKLPSWKVSDQMELWAMN